MYCDDSQDRLPYSSTESFQPATLQYVWVNGTMDYNPANLSNWDVTQDIHKSPLWKYCGTNASIWRCPSDSSYVSVNGVRLPRVRSMSMNLFLGGFGGSDGGLGPGWKIFLKLNEITPMTASKLFVFLDMRADSIDVGNFATNMDGYSETTPNGSLYKFNDLPGAYHDGAVSISYADGRVESHRWLDRRTTPPLVNNGMISDSYSTPNNPDVAWLQARATRQR
jgi:hypothetical protein